MRALFNSILTAILILSTSYSCTSKSKTNSDSTPQWLVNAIQVSEKQLNKLASDSYASGKLPRSIAKDGSVRLEDSFDWTSGFFPGSLWYGYELTDNSELKKQAEHYTSLLYNIKDYTGTHDLGFMMFCSYGNQLRLDKNDSIAPILVQTADNLIARYNPEIKAIRSWDFGEWNFPVIIDNMMNLDLLFWASDYTKDSKYRDIAIAHSNTTLDHHFRPNMSSYHVISYNNDGTVESKGTFQGLADESSWARGQAWGVYGYTVVYSKTMDAKHLKAAEDIAKLIMELPSMPADKIPYWDYDDKHDENSTPRDASAAAVTAAGLLQLSTLVENGDKYFTYAEEILKNLSSSKYLAEVGSNQGFILKHSTGNKARESEVDTPLSYADYYYLEALKRYMDIKGYPYPLKN